MGKLSEFMQKSRIDRTELVDVFNNSNELGFIWERAKRASVRLVDIYKEKGLKSGYWFSFEKASNDEELKNRNESDSFKDIAFEARLTPEEEFALKQMINRAIEKKALVDLAEEPEGKVLNVPPHAYCFREVWKAVESYMKKDISKSYGGIKTQATEEEREAMNKAEKALSKDSSIPKERIQEFCSKYVKRNAESVLEQDEDTIIDMFKIWCNSKTSN